MSTSSLLYAEATCQLLYIPVGHVTLHLKLMVLRICKVYYKYKFYNFILLKLMERTLINYIIALFLSIAILAKALELYKRHSTFRCILASLIFSPSVKYT